MRKDFQQQVIDQYFKQNQKLDPFVFTTPQVQQYISQINKINTSQFILSYLGTNIILAPLQTIITSLQLSVQKHKNIYQTQQSRNKQIAKLNTQMTIHQKRRFQLMIRSGGKTIPYTAPVYNGYKQTFIGLKNQGWKSFYKGIIYRSMGNFIYLLPFITSSTLISVNDLQTGIGKQLFKLYLYCMIIDTCINPIHMLENRFILQNTIKQFRSIRKPFKQSIKMAQQGQVMKGIAFHFINNTIGFITRFPVYFTVIGKEDISMSLYGLFLGGELITYPFSTAYKRLQCQSDRYVGMIPTRYSGLFHAMRVMAYEEGIRGFYRGFGLHTVQTLLRIKLLEVFGKFSKQIIE